MTACVNCAREVQPAWKYCIYCGTRTPVAAPAASGAAASAPRSRPLPKRTPVPGYASVATAQAPIVPVAAPAPLSAAPVENPVSSVWPETMGERPSLRSALAATEVPAPTPPREDVDAPEGEEEPVLEAVADEVQDDVAETVFDDEPLPEPTGLSIADLAHEVDDEVDDEDDELVATDIDDEPGSRRRSVNVLAILALAIGILACPLAALFGHLALGQLKVSGERGVIPAWIALVLGYLWLGFWIVVGVTYFATNG
jgi:hypothetical protein